MANVRRGEIEAELDGKSYTLCLTLGALAELETAFGDDDMISLASRFEKGRISATDCIRIVGAGLRGGGTDVSDQIVAAMTCGGGAAGFVDIVARLLKATFGDHDNDASARVSPQPQPEDLPAAGGEAATGPFPGMR
jgi:Phage tail tube protein, GTA-gp10